MENLCSRIDIGGQTQAGVVDARGNIMVQTSFDTKDIVELRFIWTNW
jgi:hypothetical protein